MTTDEHVEYTLPTTRVSVYHPGGPVGPPPGSAVTPCVLLSPHGSHGAGDWQTSWWCPGVPETVPQTPENLLAELEAQPVIELTTQEQLLTALDELLDNALHGDECYVNPNDTICFCVIGTIRDALPQCEAVQMRASSDYRGLPVHGAKAWRCQRTAHPANPDRHVFTEA